MIASSTTGDGTTYEVTFYDSALRPGGSVPATLSGDGRELAFTMPSQFSVSGPSGPFVAILTPGGDPDTAILWVTSADQTTVLIPFRRAPE